MLREAHACVTALLARRLARFCCQPGCEVSEQCSSAAACCGCPARAPLCCRCTLGVHPGPCAHVSSCRRGGGIGAQVEDAHLHTPTGGAVGA